MATDQHIGPTNATNGSNEASWCWIHSLYGFN